MRDMDERSVAASRCRRVAVAPLHSGRFSRRRMISKAAAGWPDSASERAVDSAAAASATEWTIVRPPCPGESDGVLPYG